jgi:hypothetical protein
MKYIIAFLTLLYLVHATPFEAEDGTKCWPRFFNGTVELLVRKERTMDFINVVGVCKGDLYCKGFDGRNLTQQCADEGSECTERQGECRDKDFVNGWFVFLVIVGSICGLVFLYYAGKYIKEVYIDGDF